MTKTLPKELTSYDLLKSLALILMICDHVGYHFYPDEMWFRVLGRLCIPIWFFLIGYANTAQLSKSLWIGGVLVALSSIVAGQYLFPINILFTILIMRYFRKAIVVRTFHSPEAMRGMFFILIFLYFPTHVFFEYGALAMLMVLFGFMVRNKDQFPDVIQKKHMVMFTAASFTAYFFFLGIVMPTITNMQALALLFGFAGVALMLWNFKSKEFPKARTFMADSFVSIFQFMGRRTLEIYVVHIIIFRGIAMALYPEEYGFMDWNFAPPGMLGLFGIQ